MFQNSQTTKLAQILNVDPAAVTKTPLGALGFVDQTVSVSQFTDGGAAVGTFTLTDGPIPLGAIAMQSQVYLIGKFLGDTSATMTIGDGTDVDRYNTSTIDVFTTAGALSAGVPSGTPYHSAAKSVVLTVTTAADFTACKTNGTGNVHVRTWFWNPLGT